MARGLGLGGAHGGPFHSGAEVVEAQAAGVLTAADGGSGCPARRGAGWVRGKGGRGLGWAGRQGNTSPRSAARSRARGPELLLRPGRWGAAAAAAAAHSSSSSSELSSSLLQLRLLREAGESRQEGQGRGGGREWQAGRSSGWVGGPWHQHASQLLAGCSSTAAAAAAPHRLGSRVWPLR
jgi:hypothetical protein